MRTFRCCWMAAGLMLAALPAFAGPKVTTAKNHRHASVQRAALNGRTASGKSAHAKHESVAGMPTERATAIQSALIKQGYLTGEPSGAWDAQTVSAMQKMQADNGWQSKITPDSRALIKLGLGGPEQAGATTPEPPQ